MTIDEGQKLFTGSTT